VLNPDQSIVDALATHLSLEVRLCGADGPLHRRLLAAASDGMAVISRCEDESNVGLELPSGLWAVWTVNSAAARCTAAHAKTVLALHAASDERNQLQSEADALATQVVNDFEELSLLRSLASAMQLPANGVSVTDMAIGSLEPLANGVGAASIAAVFVNDDDVTIEAPCWSGHSVASDAEVWELIEENREEAAQQPVVRNRSNEFGHLDMPESINEFVLLECRSEGRLHGWLLACNRMISQCDNVPWAQHGFTTVQASLLETATHQLAAQVHNMRLLRQKEALYTDVVRALVNAVEARDPYTCGHSERVARFAKCLGKAIGQSDVGCDRIYLTGLLHDVGKIAVPDGVLQKPGHLDEEERAIIETHTEAGWRILHELDALRDVLPGVLYHHEHYDGNGYPDGLVGENIPLDGRILAVCDAFDAMTSDRPYRDGMPIEKAAEILKGGSGRFWDPQLIEAFIAHLDEINQIRLQHRPREQATRRTSQDGQPVT